MDNRVGVGGLAGRIVGELRGVNGEVDGTLEEVVQAPVRAVVRSGRDAEKVWCDEVENNNSSDETQNKRCPANKCATYRT